MRGAAVEDGVAMIEGFQHASLPAYVGMPSPAESMLVQGTPALFNEIRISDTKRRSWNNMPTDCTPITLSYAYKDSTVVRVGREAFPVAVTFCHPADSANYWTQDRIDNSSAIRVSFQRKVWESVFTTWSQMSERQSAE